MSDARSPKAGIAVVFVALVAYMVVDPLLSREVFATEPKRLFPVLVLVGVMAAYLTWRWLRRSEMPGREVIAVSILFGLGVGAAGYPTTLHLNRMLDTGGLKRYEYRVLIQEPVVFEPVESGLPKIDYFKRTAYWERFDADARLMIPVRRGAFGLWQFSIEEIVNDIRRFQRGEKPVLGVPPPPPESPKPDPAQP